MAVVKEQELFLKLSKDGIFIKINVDPTTEVNSDYTYEIKTAIAEQINNLPATRITTLFGVTEISANMVYLTEKVVDADDPKQYHLFIRENWDYSEHPNTPIFIITPGILTDSLQSNNITPQNPHDSDDNLANYLTQQALKIPQVELPILDKKKPVMTRSAPSTPNALTTSTHSLQPLVMPDNYETELFDAIYTLVTNLCAENSPYNNHINYLTLKKFLQKLSEIPADNPLNPYKSSLVFYYLISQTATENHFQLMPAIVIAKLSSTLKTIATKPDLLTKAFSNTAYKSLIIQELKKSNSLNLTWIFLVNQAQGFFPEISTSDSLTATACIDNLMKILDLLKQPLTNTTSYWPLENKLNSKVMFYYQALQSSATVQSIKKQLHVVSALPLYATAMKIINSSIPPAEQLSQLIGLIEFNLWEQKRSRKPRFGFATLLKIQAQFTKEDTSQALANYFALELNDPNKLLKHIEMQIKDDYTQRCKNSTLSRPLKPKCLTQLETLKKYLHFSSERLSLEEKAALIKTSLIYLFHTDNEIKKLVKDKNIILYKMKNLLKKIYGNSLQNSVTQEETDAYKDYIADPQTNGIYVYFLFNWRELINDSATNQLLIAYEREIHSALETNNQYNSQAIISALRNAKPNNDTKSKLKLIFEFIEWLSQPLVFLPSPSSNTPNPLSLSSSTMWGTPTRTPTGTPTHRSGDATPITSRRSSNASKEGITTPTSTASRPGSPPPETPPKTPPKTPSGVGDPSTWDLSTPSAKRNSGDSPFFNHSNSGIIDVTNIANIPSSKLDEMYDTWEVTYTFFGTSPCTGPLKFLLNPNANTSPLASSSIREELVKLMENKDLIYIELIEPNGKTHILKEETGIQYSDESPYSNKSPYK